jgi:hypothetical protein
MGTRADFYIGRGKRALWLGSVAFDGYPAGRAKRLLDAKTERQFIGRLDKILRDDDVEYDNVMVAKVTHNYRTRRVMERMK